MNEAASPLRCPVCGNPLFLSERTLQCERRHSFDLAKEGYDIWVYTANFYSFEYIRTLLQKYRAPVCGIITGTARKARINPEKRKSIETMFLSITHSSTNTGWVTIVYTTVRNIRRDITAKVIKAILFFKDRLHADRFTILFETITTSLIFSIWMNIWVIPKNRRLNAFRTKRINAINTTRRTTSVH